MPWEKTQENKRDIFGRSGEDLLYIYWYSIILGTGGGRRPPSKSLVCGVCVICSSSNNRLDPNHKQAWGEEEEDAARHRQEKREATRLGKLQSHTEA